MMQLKLMMSDIFFGDFCTTIRDFCENDKV